MKGIKNNKGVLYLVGTQIQMEKMIPTLEKLYPQFKFHISMLIPKNPEPILGHYKKDVLDEKNTQLLLPFKKEVDDEEHTNKDQKE